MTPRRRNWFVRVLSWPVSLVLIIATVAAGDQIIKHTPGSEEVTRPFVHSGRMGDVVDGLSFTAKVDSVRGGRTVADPDGGDAYTTDGLFLLVSVTVTAKTDTTRLDHLGLTGGGKTYWATGRVDQRMGTYSYQPGIPVKGEIVFEVPRTAAVGLVAQLGTEKLLAGGNRNQTVAQIDLGIDQAQLTKWLAVTEPLKLTTPELT